jgi:hypothetical protein
MNIIDLLMAFAIVLMSFWGMVTRYKLTKIVPRPERFIQRGLTILFGLWGVFYILVIFDMLHFGVSLDVLTTRSWIVRPLILMTLTLFDSAGEARIQTHGC